MFDDDDAFDRFPPAFKPLNEMETEEMNREFLDTMHELRGELRQIAQALSTLGVPVGAQLYLCVDQIERCHDIHSRVCGIYTSELLQSAQLGTANMLRMALAIPDIIERSKCESPSSNSPS